MTSTTVPGPCLPGASHLDR
ncbi:hypothetical protein E2C01_101624 [Portunus trituberculatus]|uniref:Uncharacterized protein n=1 Tax=Portunus trituberculatus TaxID=210409 RepID=A0A5B7KMD4_PORTR|nr:hypothetical protein [Portunus trituberculatus]